MRRTIWALTLVSVMALCFVMGLLASAAPILPPPPSAWVTDNADFLSAPTRQSLNTRLEAYEHFSGHQVIVWIGKTNGGEPVEDWAARTFKTWRVGRKGIDDGIVLFLLKDNRAVRIEVGYGLEEKVTDAAASRLIREVIVPRIQAGDRDGAVTLAVDCLIGAIDGTNPDGGVLTAAKPISFNLPAIIAIILVSIVMVAMLIMFAVRYPAAAWYIVSILLSRGDRGNSGGFGSGNGGNSGGWFGGGGFSGGGGRSGGGGASGKW